MNTKYYSAFRLALIIPFYNEEKRINTDSFTNFADQNKDVLLILVDDGSTDSTKNILGTICNISSNNTTSVILKKNFGKGNAIRAGMEKAITFNIPFIGYMDADLSAPFDELLMLHRYIQTTDELAVFGSRLKKLGSDIKRSLFRHITGRIIATIIDSRFKIGCYDTQCSAKIFTLDSLKPVIIESFYTRWFFDIELILRIRKKFERFKIQEIPLNQWEHKTGSKITIFSSWHVIRELFILFAKY